MREQSFWSAPMLRWAAAAIVVFNGFFPAVWILFTSLKTEAELAETPVIEKVAKAPRDLSGAGRILFVEDEAAVRGIAARLLRQRGYEVIEAEDGPSGLLLADRTEPAIILLDIQLPDIDGIEVARRIRAAEGWPPIPMIAITSFAMAGDREKCLAAGCDDYDTKPIELPRLLEKMQSQLGDKFPA